MKVWAIRDGDTPGDPYLTCNKSQIHAATNHAWSGDQQYALKFADEESATQFAAAFLRQYLSLNVVPINV